MPNDVVEVAAAATLASLLISAKRGRVAVTEEEFAAQYAVLCKTLKRWGYRMELLLEWLDAQDAEAEVEQPESVCQRVNQVQVAPPLKCRGATFQKGTTKNNKLYPQPIFGHTAKGANRIIMTEDEAVKFYEDMQRDDPEKFRLFNVKSEVLSWLQANFPRDYAVLNEYFTKEGNLILPLPPEWPLSVIEVLTWHSLAHDLFIAKHGRAKREDELKAIFKTMKRWGLDPQLVSQWKSLLENDQAIQLLVDMPEVFAEIPMDWEGRDTAVRDDSASPDIESTDEVRTG